MALRSGKDKKGARVTGFVILILISGPPEIIRGSDIRIVDGQFARQYGNETDDMRAQAVNTMTYHRSMMNEYLCRNYLAHEIVNSLRNRSIDKRVGNTAANVRLMRESMLEDSGSKKYKDWLARSTTLEDIYRHYEDLSDGESSINQGSKAVPIEDDEVTGYAFIGQKVIGPGPDFEPSYGFQHYEHEEDDEHNEKGVKLKELFDLALTAIAFLAFGTFITEVMMNAMGVQNQEAQMMIVSPVPAVNGISFKSNYEDLSLRTAEGRSLPGQKIPAEVLNEMSRRVLSSIEALTTEDRDGGNCLKVILCEANKYSRSLSGIHKLWLPMWSFGASWMAGKFLKEKDHSLLENLKAALFGFTNADCGKIFGQCAGGTKRRKK